MKRRSSNNGRILRFVHASLESLELRRMLCSPDDLAGFSSSPHSPESGGSLFHFDAAGPETIDVLDVPAFSSRPGALNKLYLDFNGRPTIEGWSSSGINGGDAGPTPAYDIDGNLNSFSSQEQANIELIWKGVSEKFSPFNIDVTTIQPQFFNGAQVVIGGDGSWHGSGGGVGKVNGWKSPYTANHVAFVWDGQGAGFSNPAYIVEAASHEVGHALGLFHQSRRPLAMPGNEYLDGFIMGNGVNGIGRWADSNLTDPNGTSSRRPDDGLVDKGHQDDLAVIATSGNGVSFRPDDAGATVGTAVNLPIVSNNGILEGATAGVIETNTDIDVYRISHAGGSLDIEVLAAEFRRMLDPKLTFLNSSGGLIQSSFGNTGSDGIGERIQFNQLNAGTYFIRVEGSFSYGDIGQYRVNVRAGTPMASNDTLGTATALGAFGRTTAEYLALGFAGTANIADGLATGDTVDFFKIVAPANTKRVWVRLSGLTTTASLTLIDDLNGDRLLGANETLFGTLPGTGTQEINHGSAVGGKTYFVRVLRGAGAPSGSYQLRITADTAPDSLSPAATNATFDPQPLRGGRLVHESIDVTMPDSTDYYRVTASSFGLFSFYLFNQDFTGDMRLDVGTDANLNSTLEAGEILATSAQSGFVGESIQNLSVTAGQKLLVRVAGQTNTSDNYVLQAIADYATGGNTTGSLAGAAGLPGRAGVIVEHLDGGIDKFDTYRFIPPAGPFSARITPLQPGASHRLEIIRDANGDGQLNHGEIIATGFNTELAVNVPNPGLGFPVDYYLRVASVVSGEFPSIGNYKLSWVMAGALTGQTLTGPSLLNITATAQSIGGYMAFFPDESSLNDLDDFYSLTITARIRVDVAINNPDMGVQIGQADGAGNFVRVGGIGTNQGAVNSLNVNLNPGTYLVRAYLPVDEREADSLGGNYALTYQTAAITDNAPPIVTASSFQFEVSPVGPTFTFDQDVSGSIDAADVVIRNLATNTTFAIDETFYSPAARRAAYGAAVGSLPDGNYRATLLAGSIRDASANPLAADATLDFFVFAGDANRDRSVNIDDFSILATRFNQPGTFSQGDFNYSGLTDIGDFSILASKFNTALPAARMMQGFSLPVSSALADRQALGTFGRKLIDELETASAFQNS